jgi:hypothetical protein
MAQFISSMGGPAPGLDLPLASAQLSGLPQSIGFSLSPLKRGGKLESWKAGFWQPAESLWKASGKLESWAVMEARQMRGCNR